jgi:sortase A
VRRALAILLVVAGALLLADGAATVLWREPVSALSAAAHQRSLARELVTLRATMRVAARADARSSAASARALLRRVERGDAIARLRIARIGLDTVVVRGTRPADLRRGPGLIASTAPPGLGATTAIAGHRTTHGAPFRRLDRLRRGDPIELRMPYGTFVYAVEGRRIVAPGAVEVLRRVGRERLVLSACHPVFSAAQRIVVFARLVQAPAGAT